MDKIKINHNVSHRQLSLTNTSHQWPPTHCASGKTPKLSDEGVDCFLFCFVFRGCFVYVTLYLNLQVTCAFCSFPSPTVAAGLGSQQMQTNAHLLYVCTYVFTIQVVPAFLFNDQNSTFLSYWIFLNLSICGSCLPN